jgi:UDP-N-acetylglucosamine--N-acetylmuramyl-(pentapeptide) pyrophosphoryl-undecaprenol N-acetylglucosamine transferase
MAVRALFTGGGTGGHVFPAVAVAQGLREREADAAVLFVGTRRGAEAQAVPKAGFELELVRARGLLAHPVKAALALIDNSIGVAQSLAVLRRFRPQVVVGSGGYVSLPVGLAAQLLGIPVVLLEQNVCPGKTTRLLARRARRVCASFDATREHFAEDGRLVVTGNPVRRAIVEQTRAAARAALGVKPEAFCILVTGASQGARSINEAVLEALPMYRERPWHIIHLTGRSDFESVRERAQAQLRGAALTWDGRDFCDDMPSAYHAADLVVARAGATTLAEITVCGLAAILIPYPHAGAHQVDNARWLEARGGAVTLLDHQARQGLAPLLGELAADEERRRRMAAASLAAGRPDAIDRIVDEVLAAARG